MSRVMDGNKFVNENKYPPSVTNVSKMVRIHHEGEDYHKATTLSAWLFAKYDISYKTFRRKSKDRRDELKEEFLKDTDWSFPRYCKQYGKTEADIEKLSEPMQLAWRKEYHIWLEKHLDKYRIELRLSRMSGEEIERENAMMLLAECGVPYAPDGTPLGIG